MKYAVLIAAAAALSLAACKKSETTEAAPAASAEAAAVETAAADAAASAAPAAFTVGEAPSKEFMVGTWGEGDACEMPINFQADGTIKDGPFAKWDIQDGALTMEGAPQKLKLKVIDEKTLESQMDGGKTHTLKRCG